jgi:hypothetical protein
MRPSLGKIRALLVEAKNKIIQPFYLRPQNYIVRYRMTVENKSGVENSVSIIAPVAPSAHNQHVQSKIVFTPLPRDSSEEKSYKNRYVLWQDTFKPNELQEYEVIFSVAVKSVMTNLIGRFLIDTYTKDNEYMRYTSSNAHVSGTDAHIKKIAEEIKDEQTDVLIITKRFYNYVLSHLEYGHPIKGLYSVHDALKQFVVDCGGFSTLFVSLCIAVGIPARVVSGFWVGYRDNDMHAWAEFLLPNGEWVPVDASVGYLYTHNKTRKYGGFGFMGSDIIAVSYGSDIALKLGEREVKLDILQHPFVYSVQGPTSYQCNLVVETDIKK